MNSAKNEINAEKPESRRPTDSEEECTSNSEQENSYQDDTPTSTPFLLIRNSGSIYASSFNKNNADDNIVGFAYGIEERGLLLNFYGNTLPEQLKHFIDNTDASDTITGPENPNRYSYDLSILEDAPTGNILVVDEYDCFKPLDMSEYTSISPLMGHADSICCIAWNKDGIHVASGSMDGLVNIWNAKNGDLLHSLEGPTDSIESLNWHPSRDIIVCSSSDSSVWIWDLSNGECELVDRFFINSGAVVESSFTPDEKSIVSVGHDGSLRVWSLRHKTIIATIRNVHSEPINCLKIGSDSNTFLTGGQDSLAKISTFESKKVKASLIGHTNSVEKVDFVKGFPWAITGSLDCRIGVWDLHSAQLRQWIQNGDAGISWIQSFDDHTLISSDTLGYVRMWDIRNGSKIASIRAHDEVIMEFDYLKKHKLLLTSSIDGLVKLFPFP